MTRESINSLSLILTGFTLMSISALILIAAYVIPKQTKVVLKATFNFAIIVIVAVYIIAIPVVSLIALIVFSAYELRYGKDQLIGNIKKHKGEIELDSYMMMMRQGTNWNSTARFTIGFGREIFRQEVLIGNLIVIRFLELVLSLM